MDSHGSVVLTLKHVRKSICTKGFTDCASLLTGTDMMSLTPVNEFVRGEVYCEGGYNEFKRLANFESGPNVLYMGDQIYADLGMPSHM